MTVSGHSETATGTGGNGRRPAGRNHSRPFEWMIAGRYLRARRKEGFISVIAGFSFLGIMLGVATLIIVMAVMNGFRHDLFAKSWASMATSSSRRSASPSPTTQTSPKDFTRARRSDGDAASIEGQVMVSSSTQALGGLVRGVREKRSEIVEARLQQYPRRHARRLRQADRHRHGRPACERVACRPRRYGDARLAARCSDPIRHGAEIEGLSDHLDLRTRHVRIRPHDDLHAARRSAEILLARLARSTSSKSSSTDPEDVDALSRRRSRTPAGRPIDVSDWRQRNETFFNVLSVERNVMFIILSLIVLVAALNIISGLMMLVKDKGRDIAILRTMGATQGRDDARSS